MDKSGIVRVCIDDFAFKKRYSYGTIMIDLDSHRIIDILDSRDKEPVIEWLRNYPNIEIVSRDGSQVYASAITEAHPRAVQISDRFHLLKNLSGAVEKYMFRLFPARVEIPATARTRTPEMQALLDTRNRAQRIRFARTKYEEGLTVNEIALLMHSSLTTVNKYLAMKEEDIPEDIDSARERQHKVAVSTREQKIAYVRKLFDEGCSLQEISRITGYVFNTIKRYLSEDGPSINGHYDNRRPGKLQSYESEILELRSKGLTYTEITEIIKKKGYTGTVDALRVFMQKEREHQKKCETKDSESKEYIPRKWMVQLIYKAIDHVKGITQEQYEEIIKKYPILGKAYEMLRNFHELMFSKNLDKLEPWMKDAEKLQIDEMNSYLAGLRKDLDAVKNSIIYTYSNGLAEGSVNKLKVIKRIMYGRNSFELLRSKLLLLESFHQIN
ncbi:ISL3 family transposase [Clostridium formicaceticum]|nr:ISL3 family transposase [Clostridium formicaceticum]